MKKLIFGLIFISSSLSVKADPVLDSSTYTPYLTDFSNIDGAEPSICQYLRIESVITVSCRITGVSGGTVGNLSALSISLPVSSSFTTLDQCAGSGSGVSSSFSYPISIASDGVQYCQAYWKSVSASSHDITVHFTYLVQ